MNDGRPLTSHRLGQEFLDIAVQFAEHPSRGHIHPAAPAGWLYFKHKRWLVFYKRHALGIEIMRAVDAVRDLPELLQTPPGVAPEEP